jgi:hypothetical protein
MPILRDGACLSTTILHESSRALGTALVLIPKRSWWLWLAWLGLPVLAAGGILASGLPVYVKFALVLALSGHGLRARPRRPERLVALPSGAWSLPESGRYNLRISAATRIAECWILLEWSTRDGKRVRRLVLADQFRPPDWRRLTVLAREQLAAHGS